MASPLGFELLRTDGRARLGRVTTSHGAFDTPAFMTVGTQGTVKGVLPDAIAVAGAQIILANTYHLMLRPGEEVVAKLGDLHEFMAWPGPILTDSGGFQVFSLADINRVDDDGVTFRSHIDGSVIELTPRAASTCRTSSAPTSSCASISARIRISHSNIKRLPSSERFDGLRSASARTVGRAINRCSGSCRGGLIWTFAHIAQKLIELDFPGYAIGGLAVGEGFEAMKLVLEAVAPNLPDQKPRYLMGVGFPRDIIEAVRQGVDMFDCVLPTRNGRNAYAFTAAGPVRLRNASHTSDKSPIETGCDCYACRTFSRGAIRHFFFAGEMLGPILVSVHNIRFYQRLMSDVRLSIREGRFDEFYRNDPRCRLGPGSSGGAVVDETTRPDDSGG